MKNHKKYTPEFKEMVVLDLFCNNKTMKNICVQYGITYPTLRKWKEEALDRLPLVLYKETAGDRRVRELQKENSRLLDQLNKKEVELGYLQSTVVRGMRVKDRKCLIEPKYPMLSISRQCDLLKISQSTYYTSSKEPSLDDVLIMNKIDEIHTNFPGFGVRLINDRLRKRYQIKIGLKRTSSLMEKMKIKIPAKQNVEMADGYLLQDLTIDHPNHVWSIDISYIGMIDRFCYLVAIIDWHSRYVVGWQLAPTMHLHNVIETMEEALGEYGVPEFMNSDNGHQFTSNAYQSLLIENEITISYNRKGKPNDNRAIERLFRSLKQEKLYHEEIGLIDHANQLINEYIYEYNYYRGHTGLNGLTPSDVYLKGASL
ncbi:IS3 family transposase [Desertibacillus haloalkaliphilus]|uniref:IS3 family transposase n=1 Tax=Desertibacillus haloalkaliphilus TaxID=1328930 RepID=UPI001C25455F|nr:IS3 family transposase [Desertibacillus haloalkaliphilus]MBU8906544.1 IS3 family transposase [Desertibacillus haloalkaliphilus]